MGRAEVLLGRMAHSVVGRGACQWAAGGEYDYVQYPEYAGKEEEYSGASGALVLVLEAVGCGRRAKVCLARFILRHAVAAVSSIFSSSACLAIRSSAN